MKCQPVRQETDLPSFIIYGHQQECVYFLHHILYQNIEWPDMFSERLHFIKQLANHCFCLYLNVK